MITLEDLRDQAHPPPDGSGGPTATVAVDGRADPAPVVEAIGGWFAADDAHALVRLVIDGEEAGYLTRADVLAWVPALERGVGSGDPMLLPGVSTGHKMIALACPVPGCPQGPRYVLFFDPADPPACDVHGAALRP